MIAAGRADGGYGDGDTRPLDGSRHLTSDSRFDWTRSRGRVISGGRTVTEQQARPDLHDRPDRAEQLPAQRARRFRCRRGCGAIPMQCQPMVNYASNLLTCTSRAAIERPLLAQSGQNRSRFNSARRRV
jgi:hypothetical protein